MAGCPGGAMARTLIVDDDRAFQLAVGSVLRRYGHDVREASSPSEVLAATHHWSPELVLVDAGLTKTPNGACAELLSRVRGGNACVVVVAGALERSPVQADAVLARGSTPEAIHALVQKLLARRRRLAPREGEPS